MMLLAVSAACMLSQLQIQDVTGSLNCSGYGGQNVMCGNVTRMHDGVYELSEGSCKDACSGLCHAGTTTVELLVGDCGYGQQVDVPWEVAANCTDGVDFLFSLKKEGCVSKVTVVSTGSNVTLNFLDYASNGLQADNLLNLSCPGIEAARLRDNVTCTAYSGHGSSFTHFASSGITNRIFFYPTGTGVVSSDTWSPQGPEQFIITFTYDVPVELVARLDLQYQIQYLYSGNWVNTSLVSNTLVGEAPMPPQLQPTTGSRVGCVNLTGDSWECRVQVRDDVGPVAWSPKSAWDAFQMMFTVDGCDNKDVALGEFVMKGVAMYTFNISRSGACVDNDVKMSVSIMIGGKVVTGGVQYIEGAGSSTPHAGTLQPAPVSTSGSGSEEEEPSEVFVGIGIFFMVLFVIGVVLFVRSRKRATSRPGTWVYVDGDQTRDANEDTEGPGWISMSDMKDVELIE